MSQKKRRVAGKKKVKKTARRSAAKPAAKAAKSPKVTPGATLLARDRALNALRFAHGTFLALLKDWPADRLTYQSTPTDNHALWTVGHLATTYVYGGSLLTDASLGVPESYMGLFGYGSKPQSDAASYPSFDEVRSTCEAAFAKFVAIVAGMTEAQLEAPLLKDSGGFASSRVELLERLAWHEGWHAGQISMLRRAIGLPGIM